MCVCIFCLFVCCNIIGKVFPGQQTFHVRTYVRKLLLLCMFVFACFVVTSWSVVSGQFGTVWWASAAKPTWAAALRETRACYSYERWL